MTRTQHIALALVFIAVNVLGALANTPVIASSERALDDSHYEDAPDAVLTAAFGDAPIVCVAASTTSGCG